MYTFILCTFILYTYYTTGTIKSQLQNYQLKNMDVKKPAKDNTLRAFCLIV